MTELRKTVARRTVGMYDQRHKRVVVSLHPGDVVGFRWEKTRTEFRAPVNQVMRAVIQWTVDANKAAKRKPKVKRGLL